MKKALAILLLTVFGLTFATPLLALGERGDAAVPACCRRNGAHHCMGGMVDGAAPDNAARVKPPAMKCPRCPQAAVPVPHHFADPSTASDLDASLVGHLCGSAQTESLWRIARDRSRLKRGPPASILS